MICNVCNTDNRDAAIYCKHCGNQLVSDRPVRPSKPKDEPEPRSLDSLLSDLDESEIQRLTAMLNQRAKSQQEPTVSE